MTLTWKSHLSGSRTTPRVAGKAALCTGQPKRPSKEKPGAMRRRQEAPEHSPLKVWSRPRPPRAACKGHRASASTPLLRRW